MVTKTHLKTGKEPTPAGPECKFRLVSDKYLCQLWLAWCRVLFL